MWFSEKELKFIRWKVEPGPWSEKPCTFSVFDNAFRE
jgi:hypothetical protein